MSIIDLLVDDDTITKKFQLIKNRVNSMLLTVLNPYRSNNS